MEEFEIVLYRKANGDAPVDDFIDSLNVKMQAKVLMTIKLLKQNGNMLHEPYVKHLSDGIFELRAKQGSDISRVLYFFRVGRKVVLTNGFIKKTQKTPPNEVDLAKKYRADYIERNEKNER